MTYLPALRNALATLLLISVFSTPLMAADSDLDTILSDYQPGDSLMDHHNNCSGRAST